MWSAEDSRNDRPFGGLNPSLHRNGKIRGVQFAIHGNFLHLFLIDFPDLRYVSYKIVCVLNKYKLS